MSEQELREKIAKEIEDGMYAWVSRAPDEYKIRNIVKQAAQIARGDLPQKTINDINKENVESNFSSTDEDAQPLTPTQKAGQ